MKQELGLSIPQRREFSNQFNIENFIGSQFRQAAQLINDEVKDVFTFHANTDKKTRRVVMSPVLIPMSLTDIEIKFDEALFKLWSPYDLQKWPKVSSRVDPKAKTLYRVEEFKVVLENKRLTSIKRSLRENKRLVALTYCLSEPEDY